MLSGVWDGYVDHVKFGSPIPYMYSSERALFLGCFSAGEEVQSMAISRDDLRDGHL